MLKDTLASFLEWVQGIGPWGAVLFAIAYVPAAVLFVPGSLLTLGAGFVFGLAKGTVIVSIGSTAGAAAAFIVARASRTIGLPAVSRAGRLWRRLDAPSKPKASRSFCSHGCRRCSRSTC